MISVMVTNDMLRRIISVENCKFQFHGERIPGAVHARLRKNSKKKSTYASNHIEGNPLTEEQADAAVESEKRHHLKPEEEVRNYYAALELLDERLAASAPFNKELLLEVQRLVVKGAGKERVGFRGSMPPGVLFAVYDAATGKAEYIPPEAGEVEALVDELVEYVENSDDHPLVKAGVIHYQLVTIHPFEDGNGRMARLLANVPVLAAGHPPIVVPAEARLDYIRELWSYQRSVGQISRSNRELMPHGELLDGLRRLLWEWWRTTLDLVAEARRAAAPPHFLV